MKDLKLIERHIFKGYWLLSDMETSSRSGSLEGELCLVMGNRRYNQVWTTGNRYIIEILMSWIRKLKGLTTDSLRLKTFDVNPFNRHCV